jgi:hypothetical protein
MIGGKHKHLVAKSIYANFGTSDESILYSFIAAWSATNGGGTTG